MTSLSLIQSVVARCLVEPGFLEAMRGDPVAALDRYEIEPHIREQILAADLDQVRRFSGFISKIQHNHLWGSFPATRLLLAYYKIELDVFAAYRATQLSAAVRKSDRNRRIAHFLEFLRDYAGLHYFPGLCETAIHEQNIWEVEAMDHEKPGIPTDDLSRLAWPDFLQLIPHPNSTLRIASFQFDPGKLVECIWKGQFQGKPPRRGLHLIAYVKDYRTARPRVLEIDPFSMLILSRIDGRRSIKSVVAATKKRLRDVSRSRLAGFFRTSAECSLISIVRGREEKCASSL